jgi:uncharacterized protein YjdB
VNYRNRQLIFGLAGLLVTMAAQLTAQQPPQISNLATGSVVIAGQTIVVTVNAPPSTFSAVGVLGDTALGIGDAVTTTPYQIPMQVPATVAAGTYPLAAIGFVQGGNAVYSNPVTIDVERSDAPQQLVSRVSFFQLDYAGDSTRLGVDGIFGDGSTVDLTLSTRITYTSDKATVVSVDVAGIVTAVGPGSANITITYGGTGGLSLVVPVSVRQPILVAPSWMILHPSQSQQFDALLSTPDTDETVNWSINPPGIGTADGTGLYTAPASIPTEQIITLTATRAVNNSQTASAQIWLYPSISVSVAPATVWLAPSQLQRFAAAVSNTPDTSVLWSINPALGTIDVNGGLYTAPATITSQQTVTVTATSAADSSKSASATITLAPAITISVSPGTATLSASQTQRFTATVANTSNPFVNWAVNPSVGAIDSTGLYTAPTVVPFQQNVTVTATSQADATKSAAAIITLMPAISTSITPPSGVTVTAATVAEIDLSWSPSTETGGTVAGYYVFRNGTEVGSTTTTSFADLGLVTGSGAHFVYGVSTLPLNTWTHLATTYDGANQNLYINGLLASSVPGTGPLTVVSGGLAIAAVNGDIFNGTIDEVRVYNRALSAGEIQKDMLAVSTTAVASSLNPATAGSPSPSPPL